MPNTFYYLRGALNEQALVAQHGNIITEAITRLLTGDYTKKNLEKLKGHPVYSFRLGDAARFLFTTHRVGGADYLLVLDYLPTHDYHKSRFLRSGVLRDYLAHQAPGELEFTTVSTDEMAALPVGAAGETAHAVALDYYRQQFIELNDSQQAALQVPLPTVISGVAGSGKSCIALSLLSSYVADNPSSTPRRIVYVTQSEALVASMRSAWQQLPVAIDTQDTVEFISYAELVRQQLGASAPPLVDKAAFLAWYDGDSAQAVYEELRICSGYDEASYLALGQRQSLVAPEERAGIYALYQRYLAYQATQGYDPAFYRFQSEPLYDFVVVDEAQDLSHGANQNLRHLARENGIVYCLDSLQQLHDRRSIRPYLLQSLGVDERHHVQLTTTHRCPRRVVAVANVVVALKHRLVGGISDKYEPTEIKGDNAIDGEVHLFSETELAASDWLSATKGTQFAVITEANHREQARALFQTELVMTPEEIKGLEYPIVVAYRLCQADDFKKIHKRLATVGEKQPTNRAKAGESQEEFAPIMNRIYTSYMRAQQTLILCEQPNRTNQCLLTPIKQLTQAGPFTGERVSQQATTADWSLEVQKQLKTGNHALARRVFLQQQLGTEEAFDALLPKTEMKAVVPAKPRGKTKPVAASTSREETREEKAIKPLFENFDPKRLGVLLGLFELEPLLLTLYNGQTLLQFIQQDEKRTRLFFEKIINDLKLADTVVRAKLLIKHEDTTLKHHLVFLASLKDDLAWELEFVSHIDKKVTPLLLAAKQGKTDIVLALLELGADVSKSDRYGGTPAHYAALENHNGVLRVLRDYHADFNAVTLNYREPPIQNAAKQGHAEAVQTCFDCGADLNKSDVDGFAPIHVAVFRYHLSVLRVLIDLGCDLNKTTDEGTTPAHFAAQYQHLDMLELLYCSGADLNRGNHEGRTPAHVAAIDDHEHVLRKLRDYGANLNLKDKDGATPMIAAIVCGRKKTVEYLLSVVDKNTTWDITRNRLIEMIKSYVDTSVLPELGAKIHKQPVVNVAGKQLIQVSLPELADMLGNPDVIAVLRSNTQASRSIAGHLFSHSTPLPEAKQQDTKAPTSGL